MSDQIGDRPTGATSPASTGRPVVLPDGWTVTVTDKIVTTVDKVAAKTSKPITLIARGLVYGLLLGTAGLVALVLLLAFVVRGLVVLVGLIPVIDDRPGRSVWIVDVAIGAGLLAAGLLFMRKGRVPKPDGDPR